MNKRFFLMGRLHAVSPFAVGSGFSEMTDDDILTDEAGNPFLPGSALAGVCRHYLTSLGIPTEDLFGTLKDEKESRIVFYEARLNGNFGVARRDGVEIGEDGTAEDQAKFDYEIVDMSASADSYFDFRMEIDNCSDSDIHAINTILNGINAGHIRIGRKTSRGFGQFSVSELTSVTLSSVEELLAFDWDKLMPYTAQKETIGVPLRTYERQLAVTSFVTVKNNATLIPKDDSGFINSETLKNKNKESVIPGTSWAGVFRHRFARILSDTAWYPTTDERYAYLDRVFGSTDNASKLIFEESVVKGGKPIQQTRNAVDRFTGGAADKALFTEEYCFGGTLTLRIHLKNGLSAEDEALTDNLLKLTLDDIENGTVPVGGMVGVGGGILKGGNPT